ncbi:PIG-L deacetylase family protein [Paenibacillus ginsengarvi]|uniref:PIG-L family deacetylase n=1 Tax=Paenibacillus ginsengarvi TaxID=400777 RepID=A0A3B0BDF3_9BACL|nr:PIG-L deacetylase family protein [Paenibacillus ginsengarvi]RKN70117.1 PIG-L family deacetylase [Paenibacillus ginsengarvi]
MTEQLRIIIIKAHPDEGEIYAGGTTALFAELGHQVKFLSLTNGCCGHHEMSGQELVERRKREGLEAAKRLGIAEYEVLDTPDGELLPDIATRKEVVRQIRRWKADIVITFHPEKGHHSDNRYTGDVVRDAAPFVNVPLFAPEVPVSGKSPVYMLMPDYSMLHRYRADIAIDIGPVLEKKLLGCDAHASQFYEKKGKQHEVPETWEGRRAYILRDWSRSFYKKDIMNDCLEKWYGSERSGLIEYAEAFELAPYNMATPTDEEWLELFPMLKR